MGKYDLTPNDIEMGVKRVLIEAYATAKVNDEPEIVYIAAGPGAGKTSVERFFIQKLKEEGKDPFVVNSDKIAEFHPQYDEALEELPEECYRITRQFVRPATPRIFEELRKNKICIINENTLDHGETDIYNAKKFKEEGYKISVNVMATDLFESRLSCYERDARALQAGITPRGCSKETQARMYNSFVQGIRQLEKLGLIDEINVYIRGTNISNPPILVYSKGDSKYIDFQEAIDMERKKQRDKLFANPSNYYNRIQKAKNIISEYGVNPTLTQNSLKDLESLEKEFSVEYAKNILRDE